MRNLTVLLAVLVLAVSCSHAVENPVALFMNDSQDSGLTANSAAIAQSRTQLWGYYDVYLDLENETVDFVPSRQSMYAVNIVKFLNNDPSGLKVQMNGTTHGDGYIDIDMDITIKHPLASENFNGYDVRGVFVGNGSGIMKYNDELFYPVDGTDQILLNADGYTRWYNPSEFPTETIFGYIPGNLASKNYNPTATLNPYKYFGEGLGATDYLWDYLASGDPQVGYFLAGTSNTRNYLIRFVVPSPGIKFGYAVVADWAGGDPDSHPSHAQGAMDVKILDNSHVYYVDDTNQGGYINLEVSVFDWHSELSAGNMQDYFIHVETSVNYTTYWVDFSDMAPSSSGDNWNTYYVDFPADNVTSTVGNEMWVIIQDADADYTNPYGIPNTADSDPLASFFRFDLDVSSEPPGPYHGWARSWGGMTDDEAEGVAVDDEGNVYVTGYYSELVDFDPGDGYDFNYSYDAHDVYLSKFDSLGKFEWARVWGGYSWDEGRCVTVDGTGNVYVGGLFALEVDFDPGSEVDEHTCNGGLDAFVCKYDPDGNYQWALTWGGMGWDECRGVSIDDWGNIFCAGLYIDTADLDPGDGVDNHTSNGDLDAYLSKFDSDGIFQWARTWGGANTDRCYDVGTDDLGNAFTAGYYSLTVDFDPDAAIEEKTSNGASDIFVSKFDPSGNFQWVRTWGGIEADEAYGLACDGSGNCAVTGMYRDSVEFNPWGDTEIHTSNGEEDVFLSLFDSDGMFVWARTWGGVNLDVGHEAAFDGAGNVYAAGVFMSEVDFDPGAGDDIRTSAGWTDIFLSKFNPAGELQHAFTTGGINADLAFSVTCDNLGNNYLAGYYLDSVNFAPVDPLCDEFPDTHISNGGFDAFVAKYLEDGCWEQ